MIHLMRRLRVLLLLLPLAACEGDNVAEEVNSSTAPPPPENPGLEGAATSGPSATVAPDTTRELR